MRPTKPELWEQVKKHQRASSQGSPPGRWGARKAALAKLEYKQKGGGWTQGPKPPKPKAK
jgi:hypothetical protein